MVIVDKSLEEVDNMHIGVHNSGGYWTKNPFMVTIDTRGPFMVHFFSLWFHKL